MMLNVSVTTGSPARTGIDRRTGSPGPRVNWFPRARTGIDPAV